MTDRKIFTNSVAEISSTQKEGKKRLNFGAAGSGQKDDEMSLLFTFSISDNSYDALKDRIANGDVLTLDELNSSYSPKQDDVDKLVAWLKGEGFEVTGQSGDSIGVYAKATVAQVEKSLQTHIMKVNVDGITYNAAVEPPSLPCDVAANVHSISGLQPHRQMHNKFAVGSRRRIRVAANVFAGASAGYPPTRYGVGAISAAYNAAGLGLTGAGQTIAILIDTVPSDADLVAFWQVNGINMDINRITKINVNNAVLSAPKGEETLDTEWASGIAPGADIRIYATGDLSAVSIQNGLDMIIADAAKIPGLRQVSISLGLGELYYGQANGEVAAQNQKFMRLAAMGVNIFVSSGDAGSNPSQDGHSPTGALQVEFASSNAYVIGVGGTTLVLDNNLNIVYEGGWSGSGGGFSTFFRRPKWQNSSSIPATITQRLVPDVCVAADPDYGAYIVFNGVEAVLGGTSWSTPVWAGFCALINEARAKAQLPALPYLNPLLYPLGGTNCFRDINQGNNGAYYAGQAYDLVTGLGAPDVANLVAALVKK